MFAETIGRMMTTVEAPGDYVSEDGLLHCGKCGGAKEVFLSLPALTGSDKPQKFPVACQCQREAHDKAEDERRATLFRNGLAARWREEGLHDQTYLKATFSDDDGGNPKLTEVCKRFVDRWPKMQENGMGLLLYGGVGGGKTYLAGCICNALLEKRVALCATSFPRILNTLQNSMDRQGVLDRLARYSCVLLDDFGVERGTEYAQEQLFAVVDSRYRAKKPTIITTNLSLKDLENPQNISYSRIFDRLLELCPIRLCVPGPSRRKGLADDRQKLARILLLEGGGNRG